VTEIVVLTPAPPVEVTVTPPAPAALAVVPPEPIEVTGAAGEAVTVAVGAAAPVTLTVGNEAPVITVGQPETITVEVAGRIGPPGPAGSGEGGGGWYRHAQAVPSDTWVIVHPLGYRPAVATEDSAGSVVVGDITYVDDYTVVVRFAVAIGGYANLS
jgi:hypothetical protein